MLHKEGNTLGLMLSAGRFSFILGGPQPSITPPLVSVSPAGSMSRISRIIMTRGSLSFYFSHQRAETRSLSGQLILNRVGEENHPLDTMNVINLETVLHRITTP